MYRTQNACSLPSKLRPEVLLLLRDGRSLLFYPAMLLEELIEQHSVHRFIANGVNLAVLVTQDQVRIHLGYILSDQPELRRALLVAFILEGHWFQSQESFAALGHRFNVRFKSARGSRRLRAKSAATINIDWFDRPALAHVINPGNKGAVLRALFANADFAALARDAENARAYYDIVATSGEINPSRLAQSDVI